MSIKHDNCKTCQSGCVFAGVDREFVVPSGKESCRVTADETAEAARRISAAIAKLATNDYGLSNFTEYTARHGSTWIKKYASTLAGLASELEYFASMSE